MSHENTLPLNESMFTDQWPALSKLLINANHFPRSFPIQTMRCATLLKEHWATPEQLNNYIKSAYPLIHESVFKLYTEFLRHKCLYGSTEEQGLYRDMSVCDLVHRFLTKRAVSFYTEVDLFSLLDGTHGSGWDLGTGSLSLSNCLSYDEIKAAALLSVGSYSVFINDGSRNNMGVPATSPDCIQQSGIVIGLIGPRFEKPGLMEWQDIIISKAQNTEDNSYGSSPKGSPAEKSWRSLWAQLYRTQSFPLYSSVSVSLDSHEYIVVDKARGILINKKIYSARLAISFETLLIEAQARAAIAGKQAYVHVVGIGLGVWAISKQQERVFLECFSECLNKLAKRLTNVSDLNFAWFSTKSLLQESYEHIKIHFSRRNPHDLLPQSDQNKLLVISYAWDGNAFPGNEFWDGLLSSSGDPAQACSSQIAELHNPYINPYVCGGNLHIATLDGEVLPISEYECRNVPTL